MVSDLGVYRIDKRNGRFNVNRTDCHYEGQKVKLSNISASESSLPIYLNKNNIINIVYVYNNITPLIQGIIIILDASTLVQCAHTPIEDSRFSHGVN